jgi:TolB protein
LCLVVAGALLGACGDASNGNDPPPPSELGSVSVLATVHGNGIDPDGFLLQIGTATEIIPAGTPTTIDSVPPGTYSLSLSGLGPGCGSDDVVVTVEADRLSPAPIDVFCYGGIAFVLLEDESGPDIVYLGLDGIIHPLVETPGRDMLEQWSPDGSRLLLTSDQYGHDDIFTVNVDGTNLQRLTTNPFNDRYPRFSPDGQLILFMRMDPQQPSNSSIRIMNADGSGDHAVIATAAMDFDPTWILGGSQVAFSCNRFGNAWDLCAVGVDGLGLRQLTAAPMNVQHAAAAPDGSWLAAENFTGQQAVWVFPTDGSPGVNLTPGEVSFGFRWAPDGSQLIVSSPAPGGHYFLQRVNRDGTGLTPITSQAKTTGVPAWSADGQRIVVDYFSLGEQQLWTMKPDGTDHRPLTSGPGFKFLAQWNPAVTPGNTPRR